jgi:hypothetical protein
MVVGTQVPVRVGRCQAIQNAGVAELADAPDLGSGALMLGVQVPSPAPF